MDWLSAEQTDSQSADWLVAERFRLTNSNLLWPEKKIKNPDPFLISGQVKRVRKTSDRVSVLAFGKRGPDRLCMTQRSRPLPARASAQHSMNGSRITFHFDVSFTSQGGAFLFPRTFLLQCDQATWGFASARRFELGSTSPTWPPCA